MMTDLGDTLWQAAVIMATGMVVVFVFLSILIFLVKLLAKLAPVEPIEAPQTAKPAVTPNQNGIKPDVIAAISAAVHQYRQAKSSS